VDARCWALKADDDRAEPITPGASTTGRAFLELDASLPNHISGPSAAVTWLRYLIGDGLPNRRAWVAMLTSIER
jgi:hypothetical protein